MNAIKSAITRMPVLFISHGGGPSFILDGDKYPNFKDVDKKSASCDSLRRLPKELELTTTRIPKAILLISAHWETSEVVHITSKPAHSSLYFDYYGFPPETYEVQYNAPGSVELANRVHDLLNGANIKSKLDPERDFDHGVFIPMMVMYPNADVPIVEMSIINNYSPSEHLDIGRALAPLRDENILIIGSGFTTHNFQGVKESNLEFVEDLASKLTKADSAERSQLILDWTKLKSARKAHPREDHLVPLFTAVGAAKDTTSVTEAGRFVVSGGRMVFSNYAFEG